MSRVTGLRPYRLGCVLIGLLELEKELMRLFIDNSALDLLFWEKGTTPEPPQVRINVVLSAYASGSRREFSRGYF